MELKGFGVFFAHIQVKEGGGCITHTLREPHRGVKTLREVLGVRPAFSFPKRSC